jgi:hypothetical protein
VSSPGRSRCPWIALLSLGLVLTVFCGASSADLIRPPTGPPAVPHTQKAAIYDLFGLNADDRKTLATIREHLSQEGYEVTLYRDSSEGAGGHGGATLANFVKMAKTASVIVINGHGTDFAGTSQACTVGKGFGRKPPNGTDDVLQICSKKQQQPVQQVEWYPSMAALHKDYIRYVTVGGFQKAWLYESPGDLWAGTLAPPRGGDGTWKDDHSQGLRPWLGLTTSGIKHFFGGRKIDLIDNQACHSMAFAASFDAKAYLGHSSTACSGFESHDEPLLFDRMTGHDNVRVRSVFDAFQLGGFSDSYFRLAANQDVVLSPAVESSSPGEGDSLTVGAANGATLGFDAKMDTSDAASVVKITGCGATITGARWNADGTELSYAINVPQEAVGEPATITVHARAASSKGDNARLDGNQQPADNADGGVEPNGDDYVVHVACHARTFPVLVDYAGTYTDDYTAGGFSWHETLTWHESQSYRLEYRNGSFSSEAGPASITASGSLATTGGSSNDSCVIASTPGIAPPIFVTSGQANPPGLGPGYPAYSASFAASMPTGTTSGNPIVQVTGTPDNCLLDTGYGIAPYLYYHPENGGFDPGGLLRTAWAGSITRVDVAALVNGALTIPFNANYIETDPLGGSDHVVVKATATVSLTGPPTGI